MKIKLMYMKSVFAVEKVAGDLSDILLLAPYDPQI